MTASDRIYSLSPYEIEQQCIQDLDIIIKQLPDIEDLKGKKSQFVEPLMHDKDFEYLQMFIEKVNYEFIKNSNKPQN